MNKRECADVTCAICGYMTKSNGIATHFKSKHNIEIDDYVKLYGEYRTKYIKYEAAAAINEYQCNVCNGKFASERHLSYHIIKQHDILKRDYIIKYILNNKLPVCKCGCGTEVLIKQKGSPPYWSEYISGHNTKITGIGIQHSVESKMKMRLSAIKRLKEGNSVFYKGVSTNETEFFEFIKSIYHDTIIQNDTVILHGLELDIYLPDINIAFEFNGDRFHSDLFKDKNYHLKKTTECELNGIRLIHIWMIDWNMKRDIIKSQIKNILGVSDTKIYARNCKINEVSAMVANKFLETNHIQGKVISKYRYGLYHDGNLVQLMTFGKLRNVVSASGMDNEYELVRLCTQLNTVVTGGVTKLYNFFIKKHTPKKIISFAHRDWSTGRIYDILNMKLVSKTTPGYFYSNGKRREHRYGVQKHKLIKLGYDANKTEYEIMRGRGYYRIWDCGNLKYETIF